MRYTQLIKDKARELREKGISLFQISTELHVPLTTVREWVYDIVLSPLQKELLKKRSQDSLQKGKAKAQEERKKVRVELENELMNKGKEEIGIITNRDTFIAGIALYWAEGFKNKHERRLGFCNSDPNMIRFYINWLRSSLGIDKKDLVIRITLNVAYKERAQEFEKFWSDFLEIPLSQFTKPFFQKSVWKREYNTDTYRGVVRIHVQNSLQYLLKMKGWLEGLQINTAG